MLHQRPAPARPWWCLLLLRQGLEAVQGDTGKRDQFYGAMEAAVIDSPRGRWRMGKALQEEPVPDDSAMRLIIA